MSEPGRLHVKLLMPLAPPQAGGATEYARLLGENLPNDPRVASVELLTQRAGPRAAVPIGDARVRAELPVVFGATGGLGARLLNYVGHTRRVMSEMWAWHRAAARERRAGGADRWVVLIHSGYSRRATAVGGWAIWLRRLLGPGPAYVLDVRDPLNTEASLAAYGHLDGAIGCSWEIVDRLRAVWPDERIGDLPVPFEQVAVTDNEVAEVLRQHGLTRGRYVFGPGGIVTLKGFEKLFDAWEKLVAGGETLPLATVGRRRGVERAVEAAMRREPGLKHLGEVPRRKVLALMKGAGVVVLPSLPGVEGVPRAALEGLSVGAVGLWPATREFVEAMPGSVAAEDAEALAEQMRAAVNGDPAVGRGGYDWRRHEASVVAGQYVAWLGALASWREAADE
ncbi:MAG: glycosyltransferase [Planctomycetota bacterium]